VIVWPSVGAVSVVTVKLMNVLPAIGSVTAAGFVIETRQLPRFQHLQLELTTLRAPHTGAGSPCFRP